MRHREIRSDDTAARGEPLRPKLPWRILHDAVPGRLRVEIIGLRHNPALKMRLEEGLAGRPVWLSVRANLWAGTLLLRFRPDRSPQEMQDELSDQLVSILKGATRPCSRAGGDVPHIAPNGFESNAEGDAGADALGPWHTQDLEQVLAHLGTSPSVGLTGEQVATALRRSGLNTLEQQSAPSRVKLLLGQFASLPVAMLLGSAVVSVASGGVLDAVAILGVVGVNAVIGFVTESEAERTIRALASIVRPDALVVREGAVHKIPVEEVAPGDILTLSPGFPVAADGRVIWTQDLTMNESLLTGESLPVRKTKRALKRRDLGLADRRNMVFKGTSVVSGQGRAVAVATGRNSEIGRIQQLAGSAKPPETPLQRQLDRLGGQLAWVSLGACALTFALGLARGHRPLEMMKSSISLAVAAVPEGLPTVATVTLALGIRQMRRRHVLIRKLEAVETLGSVSTVCFDKTGTLTENRMTTVALIAGDRHCDVTAWREAEFPPAGASDETDLSELLKICVLCNEASVEGGQAGAWLLNGSATEAALLELALDLRVDVGGLRSGHPVLETTYRGEGRNFMVTRHALGDGRALIAVKGSPVEVLGLCAFHRSDGRRLALDDEARARVTQDNRALAARGLRVLAFADAVAEERDGLAGLTWLGLVGLADPVRPHMADLMRVFHDADVRTTLITGDQTATAYAIARELDLSEGAPVEILEGTQLDRLEPELLSALARKTHVFARASPANKLQIVRAFQQDGWPIAMTGDGINDSPALRAADIGVALGSGTEMAHEVADLVLEDDRLETMAVALAQGRTTYDNIRKAIHFLIATNLGEILVMLAATGLRLGPPLTPMQLLWINLVTDVFPALALAVDPADPGVLKRPPRNPKEPVVGRKDLALMGLEGGVITACSLGSYLAGRRRYGPGPPAAGMAFTTLTVSQLFHAYSGRSSSHTIFDRPRLAANPSLRLAVGGMLALQTAISSAPATRRLLGLGGLRPTDLALAAGSALMSFIANEGLKLARRDRDPLAPPESGGEEI